MLEFFILFLRFILFIHILCVCMPGAYGCPRTENIGSYDPLDMGAGV